jgi:hypothetical protein
MKHHEGRLYFNLLISGLQVRVLRGPPLKRPTTGGTVETLATAFRGRLANNKHGKTTMMNALLSQGSGTTLEEAKKGRRTLVSPWGREIDALIFVRSFQETEKPTHKNVADALKARDAGWRKRELIILPSHVEGSDDDVDKMIDAAHGARFDAICASVIFTDPQPEKRSIYADIWRKPWDERWTVPNQRWDSNPTLDGQLRALGAC